MRYMSILTARSRNDLNRLINGEELSIDGSKIKLPADDFSVPALSILIDKFENEQTQTSVREAEPFLNSIIKRAEELSASGGKTGHTKTEDIRDKEKFQWKLHKLKTSNFRGLSEWNGKVFELDFEGRPWLIYGPNGSGKTSIISAIVWCLTGHCLKERTEPQAEISCIDIYNEKVEKACTLVEGWPAVVTIPHNLGLDAIKQTRPTCWVEIELRSVDKAIYIKREINDNNAESSLTIKDGSDREIDWQDLGVSDLCTEISLLMPSRVSSIKFEEGSKISEALLSVAGLDSLQAIGKLARDWSTNLAKFKGQIDKNSDDKKKRTDATLNEILSSVDTEIQEDLKKLRASYTKNPGETENLFQNRLLAAQAKAVEERASKEFAQIKEALALDTIPDRDKQGKIAEDLSKIRHNIGENLESWQPIASWLEITDDPASLLDKFRQKVEEWKAEISKSYSLWEQNQKEKGKLAVKIKAAKYMEQQKSFDQCPVCDQDLPEAIKERLKELAKEDEAILIGVDSYVRSYENQINALFPSSIPKISTEDPKTQIKNMLDVHVLQKIKDVKSFKEDFLETFDKLIQETAEISKEAEIKICEEGWDTEFKEGLGGLEKSIQEGLAKIAVAKWTKQHLSDLKIKIEGIVFGSQDDSLIERLTGLERYTNRFLELDKIRKQLTTLADDYQEVDKLIIQSEEANRLHEVLSQIRKLEEYSKAQLIIDLEAVSAKMSEFYDILYPSPDDPIRLSGLASKTTKKGSKPDIRFMLKWTDNFVVEADPIANAGRIRALLWSFAFALLDRQKPSLLVVPIDDPAISLDDYHRKNMINEVIKKNLAKNFQALATLHDEYLLHETWVSDPTGEEVGLLKTLQPDGNHRYCRTEPAIEPLHRAVADFQKDKSKHKPVLDEVRRYLERTLQEFALYLLPGDYSGRTAGDLLAEFKKLSQGQIKGRPITEHFDVGKLVGIIDKGPSKYIIDEPHHAGKHEGNLSANDTQDVSSNYKKWVDSFRLLYKEIEEIINKCQQAPVVRAESIKSGAEIIKLNPCKFGCEISEIGKVAAEGEFAVYSDHSPEIKTFRWPALEFAIIASDSCRPVAWAGQVGLFTSNEPINEGDLTLIQFGKNTYLRRVHKASQEPDNDTWIGSCINPSIRGLSPVIFKQSESSMKKLIAVLYPTGSELKTPVEDKNEVIPLPEGTSWPTVMQKLNGGKTHLISVIGDSADPVALDKQFLIVEEVADIKELRDNRIYCVLFEDGRALLKRYNKLSDKKAVLQPINTLSSLPVIECRFEDEENDKGSSLPVISKMWLVCGMLFKSPDELN